MQVTLGLGFIPLYLQYFKNETLASRLLWGQQPPDQGSGLHYCGLCVQELLAGSCSEEPAELLCSTGTSKWVTMHLVQLPIHDHWGHTWPTSGCL